MAFEIDKKIKQLRKEAGFTQEQLAKLLNKTKAAISNWENGYSKPDIEDVRKMCKIFDISADYFLDLDEYEIE